MEPLGNIKQIWEAFKVEEIITASQVANLLQMHLRTVYKLVRRGSIPGRKFGGGWRFSKNEILKMAASNGEKSSTDHDGSVKEGNLK